MGGDELKVVHEAFGSNYITRLGCYTACLGGWRRTAQGSRHKENESQGKIVGGEVFVKYEFAFNGKEDAPLCKTGAAPHSPQT